MNRFDAALQPGSRFMIALGIALTAFFAAYYVLDPERRYTSAFLVLVGLLMTWRQIERRRSRERKL
jgi:hypothetical protein